MKRFLLLLLVLITIFASNKADRPDPGRDEFYYDTFPEDFLWGFSTSAYQTEGGWNVDGKGESNWDHLVHNNPDIIVDGSNADVSCDSYHKFKDDVGLLKNAGADFYRFSISWSRILPDGTTSEVNQAGVDHYNNMINELLSNGFIPMVTLYHFDLPQKLVENVGFWDKEELVQYFANYSRVAYENFGDRVKHWITFNEPYVFCNASWSFPNGFDGATSRYACHHNVIKSHGLAYRIYDQEFRPKQNGVVGITLNSDWAEPMDGNNAEHVAASTRFMQFRYGTFAHPLVFGDYPPAQRKIVDEKSEAEGRQESRLPKFSEEWKAVIKGSADFLGLNHYSSRLVAPGASGSPGPEGDAEAVESTDPEWPQSAADWLLEVPWGFRRILKWIGIEYGNLPIYVTENGWAESSASGPSDPDRVRYYRNYINEMLKAVRIDGVNLRGYSAWSLMDNFEWIVGYTVRFGVNYINFEDPNLTRLSKDSARFLAQVIRDNGFPAPK